MCGCATCLWYVLCVCVTMPHAFGMLEVRGQKMLDPLELELGMIVSLHTGAGNRT